MKESSPSSDFYTKTCCQLIGLVTKLDTNKIAPTYVSYPSVFLRLQNVSNNILPKYFHRFICLFCVCVHACVRVFICRLACSHECKDLWNRSSPGNAVAGDCA